MPTLGEMVIEKLLICPRCGAPIQSREETFVCGNANCRYSHEAFPTVSGMPALIDFEKSVINANRLRATDGGSELNRDRNRLKEFVRGLTSGRNKVAPRVVDGMLELLKSDRAGVSPVARPPVRILVVGGASVGSGLESLYRDNEIDLIAFDVYSSPFVQFVADGHSIPLADASVDGVIVQAVLEHVTDPWRVVEEIHRVLRPGGVVYADTPFMQQVHEGAYDFTRFTDSGHRYLFRRFERIDSGAVTGAGAALAWSIEYFTRALTRSKRVGRLARLCFFWLRYTDGLLDPKYSLDAACGVYFLGRKCSVAITQGAIIEYYQGGM
jgi:SAM-dependent methyltransferase